MTLFLDSAIFMYAAGADHRLREPCRRVLAMAVGGEIVAATSAEVVQELIHLYLAIRRVDVATSMAREVLESFGPVLPIGHGTVSRLPDLITRYPWLSSRDLLHIATCVEEGIGEIVTPDRDFDRVREIRRVDPTDIAA